MEDIRLVDVFELELEVAVVIGTEVVTWLKVVELVDIVEPEDAKRVEIVELEDPVVMEVETTAFEDTIELSVAVIPFQTTWQELVLKFVGICSQRRRSLPRT